MPGMSIPGMSMSCGCARGFDPRGEISLRDDAGDRLHFGMAGAADLRALNTCHRVSHSLNHAGRRDDERLYLTRNDRPFESPGRHPEGVDDVLGPQREADRPVDRNDTIALISELPLRDRTSVAEGKSGSGRV